MNSPESHPATGLDLLKEALALDPANLPARKRATWEAVQSVEHHAVTDLAYNHLWNLAQPRADLSASDVAHMRKTSLLTAEFVVRAFQRGLVTATHTLGALSRATPSPVHGQERRGLSASVRRPMIAAGFDITPDVERKLVYAVADVFARALARPAKPVPQPTRFIVDTEPYAPADIVDHDEIDWLTGQPLSVAQTISELLSSAQVEDVVPAPALTAA